MPSQPSEGEVSQAVLGFVTDGVYPEEKVVAAEFPAEALGKELELISKAREQVEVSGQPENAMLNTPRNPSILTILIIRTRSAP